MSEEITIVGGDKTVLYPVDAIPGSKLYPCSKCSTEVVLAPTSQAILKAKPQPVILCGSCAEKDIAESDPKDTTFGIAKGGIEELYDEVNRRRKYREN